MSRLVERYHVLFDSRRTVAEGHHRLKVTAHVRVLHLPVEHLCLVLCDAATSDDQDHEDWLPPASHRMWPGTGREAAILRVAEVADEWTDRVRRSIPEGFLEGKREQAEAPR